MDLFLGDDDAEEEWGANGGLTDRGRVRSGRPVWFRREPDQHPLKVRQLEVRGK